MWLHTPQSTIYDYKMLLKHVITICNYTHHGPQYVITTCDYDMWLHTPHSTYVITTCDNSMWIHTPLTTICDYNMWLHTTDYNV